MQWRFSRLTLFLLVLAGGTLVWTCAGGLSELLVRWDKQPEYGHGYFIPVIAALLIWEQRTVLRSRVLAPSWSGFALVCLAMFLYGVGELSALFLLIQYAFVLALLGLCLALTGWRGLRILGVPILLLLFAIPLPYFLEAQMTARLQLVSSQLGVMFIRLWGIPVYLEGNLIDLGQFQMQVVEACSGLAYLYPLLGLGCICTYIFHSARWKKVIIIASTIPIAILLNSLRIGVTGVLVRHWGAGAAAGFLHEFQGWAVFLAGVAVLLLEMWSLRALDWHDSPVELADGATWAARPQSWPYLASIVSILGMAALSGFLEQRSELVPIRATFNDFPMTLGAWHGQKSSLDPELVTSLGLSDYLLADYAQGNVTVNLYIAYYASQRKGVSPHSPTVCMPGGGWTITQLSALNLPLDRANGENALPLQRGVIQKNDIHEVIYYWYQARGRAVGNEYLMKWYLFKDALLANRSDGALVRVRIRKQPGETNQSIDEKLAEFVTVLTPRLTPFLPD